MTRFSVRNRSVADIPARRIQIWDLISSPERLARLTPLVRTIRADGEQWCWQLTTISAFGVRVAPSFVELMRFDDQRTISFSPAAGGDGRAGAEGDYRLSDNADGTTRLAIDLTMSVELPLPGFLRGGVERLMASMMRKTGARFAQNVYRELGIDGSGIVVREGAA